MLYRLLVGLNKEAYEVEVVSLTGNGQLGDKIRQLGIPVKVLGIKQGLRFPSPLKLRALWRYLEERPVDVIQTWMYHADLIAGLIGKWRANAPIIWNIRADVAPYTQDKKTFLLTKACAYLSSSLPTRIVSCSETARKSHLKMGYDGTKIVVIPNGFDLTPYRNDQEVSTIVRQELGLESSTPLIGLVTRYDRRKDLPNFAQAAALLLRDVPTARFLLCGNGIHWENKELTTLLQKAGIEHACFLLGRREDVTHIMSALDLATSSSNSEAFPNVLGEAMACGIPCVATDVGDSALILGDAGIVVPPGNAQALAAGWRKILMMSRPERVALGGAARRRIEENFSLGSVVARYENLYREVSSQPVR